MEIRPPVCDEELRGAICAHGLAWREAYEGIVPGELLAAMTVDASAEDVREWTDRIDEDRGQFFVAIKEETGHVLGYAYVRWSETKAFVEEGEAGLKEIYVHPEHWGEGVGTALLEESIDCLPEEITALKLEVFAGNERGRAFYEARGFEQVGEDEIEMAGTLYPTRHYGRQL